MNHLKLALARVKKFIVPALLLLNLVFLGLSILGVFAPDVVTPPPVSQPARGVTTIRVPVPVITEKVVTQYFPVEDRKEIDRLLKENRELSVKVNQLSFSLAQWNSTGEGKITILGTVQTPAGVFPQYQFKDWRLTFDTDGATARYSLNQQFVIVNSVGRNKNNVEVNLIRLFEVGPNQERRAIPTEKTTTIVAAQPTAYEGWYVKPTIQAGWSANFALPTPTLPAGKFAVAGVVAVPWLKRGKTRSVEDTTVAFFTPSLILNKGDWSVGVLPVSFNLGTLPRQPFSDVWISPYVGSTKGTSINRVGVVLSVTF